MKLVLNAQSLVDQLLGQGAPAAKKLTETTASELKDMDLSELVQEWMQKSGNHHLEGERGVRTFTDLAETMNPDYRDVDAFLQDNSGCIEAMISWVEESGVDDWAENLRENLLENGEYPDEEGEEEEPAAPPAPLPSGATSFPADEPTQLPPPV